MSKIDSWTCDICNRQKAETNRWWLVSGDSLGAVLSDWEHGVPEEADAHLCGAACVMQWLSKNIFEERANG